VIAVPSTVGSHAEWRRIARAVRSTKEKRMGRLTRKLAATAIGVGAVVVGVGMVSSPAGAAIPAVSVVSYSNNVAPGVTFTPGEARCGTNHTLQLDPLTGTYFEARQFSISADAPAMYARNATSAVDRQYVASRLRLVDRTTNQIVAYGAYTPWMLAADNAPARGAGTNFSRLNVTHRYDVQEEMLWSNANGTRTTVIVKLLQYRQLTWSNGQLTSNTIQSACVVS
jgi:hypothetical protein